MSNIFDAGRADPMVPVVLTPLAAQDGIEDDLDGDGPGLGLDFFISLGAKIGSLADAIDSDRTDRQSRQQAPGDAQLNGAAVATSAGLVLIDLGSVPQGRVWDVRRLVVGGATVTTAAVGVGYVFAQGAPPNDKAITGCVDIFSSLPMGNTYGTHQLFLLRGEHLWILISGATPGQQYGASCRIEDWAETTYYSTYAE